MGWNQQATIRTRNGSDGPNAKFEVQSSKFEMEARRHEGTKPRWDEGKKRNAEPSRSEAPAFFELRTLNFELQLVRLAILFCSCLPIGCGVFSPTVPVGVTTGGTEDNAFARQLIESGEVPDPAAITVEGFLSEHSIDLAPPAEPSALYARTAAAWNADFDELTPLVTIQVGFGTNIDLASFHRDPINLCLVIDRSGSMDEDFDLRSRSTKLDAVRIAIDRLLASLTADDRVSVVTFAEQPTTLLEPVPGNDIISVKSSLEGLIAAGAADLAAGMVRGYQVVQGASDPARSDRIMVFTDAQVTSGISQSEDFLAVMRAYVDDGIGATLVGVGVDFGQQLATDIFQVRGGNFVYLNDYDRIRQVFDEEFDFLVSPIAEDIRLAAEIPFSLDVTDAFGLPNVDTSTHTLELVIPTLFYSTRQGGSAILIRLRPGSLVDFSQAIEAAVITLEFDADGATTRRTFRVTLPAGLDPAAVEPYFQNSGTQRAVLLLNTALVLQNAAKDAYSGYIFDPVTDSIEYQYPDLFDYERAIARLTEFLPYFDTLAAGLVDQPDAASRSLSEERVLVVKLLENVQTMRTGSPSDDSFCLFCR